MARYQLIIEYVGTNFRGWQIQKKGSTIQGIIQQRISQLLKEKIIGTPGRIALKRPEGVIVIARDRGLLLTKVSSSMEGSEHDAGDKLKAGNNLE